MRGLFIAALLLAGLLAAPELRAQAALPEADEAAAGICYRDKDGFVVAAPQGWVNLPQAAAAHGVCMMYAPAGYDFDNAPAIIYPRLAGLPDGGEAFDTAAVADAMADSMMKRFAALPGGGRAVLLKGPALQSESGLLFATRYFNNGPDPNNFELVAYHRAESAVLLLVLSARTGADRLAGEAALRQVAGEVFHLKVRQGAEPESEQ